MATVFLARPSDADKPETLVAIKRLHPHLAHETEFVAMLVDEARLVLGIDHPNVVRMLEIQSAPQGGFYLVMDYVEGTTLGRLLARASQIGRSVPPSVSVRIILDALHGLHAAHELRDEDGKPLSLVHRDVSPQNVLVGIDGQTRLTDFGVAKASSRLASTRAGQLKGKLAYMSPEQARSVADVDRRADLFAMGILSWEALTGRRLFKGDNDVQTLQKMLNQPIPKLRTLVPEIPAEFEAVVDRALERDRDRRFASAIAMAEALEQAESETLRAASEAEVASFVREMVGDELSERREVLEQWGKGRPASVRPLAPLTPATKRASTKVATRGRKPGRFLFAYAATLFLVLVAVVILLTVRGCPAAKGAVANVREPVR